MSGVIVGLRQLCAVCTKPTDRTYQCVICDRRMCGSCESKIPNWETDVCKACEEPASRMLKVLAARISTFILKHPIS